MLRLSVENEEYIMIGDDVKIVFLGGSGKHHRIMIDAPKEVSIARSKALEKRLGDPDLIAKMPKYYAEEEHPEKYKKKEKCEEAKPLRKTVYRARRPMRPESR